MRRSTVTDTPLAGDYILSTSGRSWNSRRSNGDGTAQSLAQGERDRKVALAGLMSRAEADTTDVWETVGTGVFWRLCQFRLLPQEKR